MELSKEKIEKAVKAYMDLTGFSDLSSDDMGRRTLGVVAVLNLAQADHEAELQAQRAVLAGEPSHEEMCIFDLAASPANHTPLNVIRRGLEAFLAARAAKLDKKQEPTLEDQIHSEIADAFLHQDFRAMDLTNRIMAIIERGGKAVQP